MNQDDDARNAPFRQDVIDGLKKRGEQEACMGALILVGQQSQAVTVLCFTRNGLDKSVEGYEKKKMFLEGAIAVIEKEMERHMKFVVEHWRP